MQYQLNNVEELVDYGLRCPDGTVLWPPNTYRGYEFDTAELRNGFASVLAGAAGELKIDPGAFVSAFAWVPRYVSSYVISRVEDDAIEMGHQWLQTEAPVDEEQPEPKG